MSLQSLIDIDIDINNPKELLELINDCLKPKEIEKKKYGEVFTPMELVNEMLDKLPDEVWINKELKWYDPAAGMGNFPIAVYLRLINTLKDIILDEEERTKHIIEKMLYMGELNKKNCLITKQIFNIENKYKLNCRPDESDNLLEFADRLDSRVRELQDNIEDISDNQLLVIAGLMLEQELQQKTDQMSGELKHQLYSEDDLYEALSEQMENITNFVKKITAKIENL